MAVYESPGAGRVLIALSDGPLVAEPTWTRYDEMSTCRCYGYDGTVGRQSEFDVTEAGRARVYFHDLAQVMNDTSLVGRQIMLQLYDPIEEAWEPRFRGHIDDISFEPSPGAPSLANAELSCVGVFSYLSRVKMIVGTFGDVPYPSGVVGAVWYDDGPVATGTNDPEDGGRIEHLMFDAGIALSMYVAFSGNVNVNETNFDPSDTIMAGLRSAADAEFPGIANVYEDRFGRVVFHGRMARFDPDTTASGASAGAWDFTRWSAATREDVTTGVAQIREFAHNIPSDRIVNSYLAWPQEDQNGRTFDQANVTSLVRQDATSQSAHGFCGIEKGNLIIKEHKTNGNTGADECGLFGDFYIANYADPIKNIQRIAFTSIGSGDPRSAATWALMTRADISDIVNVTVDEGGFAADDYFIEGVDFSCRPANDDVDLVTVSLNLSPAAYFDDGSMFEDA